MSDDNIIQFPGKVKQKEDTQLTSSVHDIRARIIACEENKKCACGYCNYKKHASKMVVDFLMGDMGQFAENTTNIQFTTYDIKDILFKSIKNIIDDEEDMEKNGN